MAFLGLLLASEAACRLLTSSGVLYRLVDVSGSITTLPELDDRIRAASRRKPLVVGEPEVHRRQACATRAKSARFR